MEKTGISFLHKTILSILTGLATAAVFNRLALNFLAELVPEIITLAFTILIIAVGVAYGIVWQLKRYASDRNELLLARVQNILATVIAIDFGMFGWRKIFHLQFWVPLDMADQPLNTISNQWLTWMYFGRSYPMDFTVGVLQIAGAILVISNRTRLAGLFIIMPVMFNIVLIDLFYDMGTVVFHALIMFAGVTYLLATEHKRIFAFFLNHPVPSIPTKAMRPTYLMVVAALPLLFTLLTLLKEGNNNLRGKYLVEKIVINKTDLTKRLERDSILSTVYLEINNTCVFQFSNYKQRIYGRYEYNRGNKHFEVSWANGEPAFAGIFNPLDARKIEFEGITVQDTIRAILIKQ